MRLYAKVLLNFKEPQPGFVSASVSVPRRVVQINAKCEQLIRALESIVRIESSEQHAILLEHVKMLCELLPCGSHDCVDLMVNHSCELESDFASDTYASMLMEVAKKFGSSHQAEHDIPVEIVQLFTITDSPDFILETMNVLSNAGVIDKSPQFVIQLLEKVLLDDSYLIFAFTRLSRSQLDETEIPEIEQFLQQIINLPDRIANKMKTEFPRIFEVQPFSAILVSNILKTFHILCQVNQLEQLKFYDMRFLSKLISKIFVHFKGDKVVSTKFLRLISLLAEKDEFRESIRDVMSRLQRQAIEIVAQLSFGGELKKPRLVSMLGDVWKSSSDWKFVLTKRIPLLSFSSNDRTVENLSYFLSIEDTMTMEKLLMELLMVWSTKSHVMDTPFEQHFYVTKLIVLMTKYLVNPKDHADNIKHQLFNGMETHIGSSDEQLKVLGMITAETMLGIIDGDTNDEDKLKFDYSDVNQETATKIVQVIRDFPSKAAPIEHLEIFEPTNEIEVVELMEQLKSIVENCGELAQSELKISAVKMDTTTKQSNEFQPSTSQILTIDLDSDDDDLQPFLDPDDSAPSKNDKRPKYLLDLIQSFTSKENLEDIEKFELAITSAECIIKQQLPSQHTDFAIDLLRIFISLERMCYMEHFDDLKMKILISICMIFPKETAQYLCQEFNTESTAYAMTKRMLMLDILTEVAKQFSKLEKTKAEESSATSVAPTQKQNKLLIKLNQELENRNKKDAQKIIHARLIAKTRRITTRTKAPDENSGINRFAEVAGWFFFPLVNGFGRKQMVFKTGTNLENDIDNLLLVKFLHTISVMMLCAENSLVAPKMAKEIMNLSVFLRYHEESKIRLAVLHMVATIILAVPRKILLNQFAQEISEFVNHLSMIVKSTVINYEPDQECREFAEQLFKIFQEALYADK